MMLCLDCGNTRLKWALRDDNRWVEQGAMAYKDLQGRTLPAPWRLARQVVIANVAGGYAETLLQGAFAEAESVHWLQSAASACGVTNGYERPQALGVDRWCALVGAWGRKGQACLVVSAGTATTIDTLDEHGRFQGGFILPGLEMMRRSLARDTAQLPLAEGRYSTLPKCTDDAIGSGAVEASVGAIERAHRRLGGAVPCLLTGGSAPLLLPHLHPIAEHEALLVLEGVWRLGANLPAKVPQKQHKKS